MKMDKMNICYMSLILAALVAGCGTTPENRDQLVSVITEQSNALIEKEAAKQAAKIAERQAAEAAAERARQEAAERARIEREQNEAMGYEPKPGDDQRGLWKPVSEGDGNLVILLPARLSATSVTVVGTQRTDKGRAIGRREANGNREHFRFPVPGPAYGPATITAELRDGSTREWSIADPSDKQGFK